MKNLRKRKWKTKLNKKLIEALESNQKAKEEMKNMKNKQEEKEVERKREFAEIYSKMKMEQNALKKMFEDLQEDLRVPKTMAKK